MKRSSVAIAVLVSACASTPERAPESGALTNQILAGRWAPNKPEAKCVRFVEFRPDGSMSLIDGAALIDATYRLSGSATPKGMYRLEAVVTRESVGKDCEGNTSEEPIPPGLAFDMGYIWMDASKNVFLMCEQDGYAYCQEAMHRVR